MASLRGYISAAPWGSSQVSPVRGGGKARPWGKRLRQNAQGVWNREERFSALLRNCSETWRGRACGRRGPERGQLYPGAAGRVGRGSAEIRAPTQGFSSGRASQVAQWQGICLLMQETLETWARCLGREAPRRREWQPSPVFLSGASHGQRGPVGCSPWGRQESDTTEHTRSDRLCRVAPTGSVGFRKGSLFRRAVQV